LICKDVTLALDAAGNATLVQADVIANLTENGENGYTVDQTGTFALETITGTAVTLGDDSGTAPLPLGFVFNYFGIEYTDIHIASNGYVSFTGTGLGEWIPASLPSGTEPNGMIAVVWDDWSPNIGGTISYEVIGVEPNRKMVVNYDNVPHYSDSGTTLTAQLQLHEGTNRIEIHTTNATDNTGVRTQGLENEAGDMAIPVSGRNFAPWGLTNDYVAFVPVPGGLPDNCGNSVMASFSQSIFSCVDIGDNIITITADDGNGGITTCQTTVTVTNSINPCIVAISPVALLQGPILNPTIPGLMNDILREEGFLPTTSPYADALTVNPTVFNVGGSSGTGLAADDIVDWVWVELRDSAENTKIIKGQSALLQRDGDIVDLDGISELLLPVAPADYYVAINHRNHMGALSQSTFGLTDATTTIVDFTDSGFSTFGTDAQVVLESGDKALWAGNVNSNRTLQYAGAGILDTSNLLAFILNDGSNFLNLPTWSVTGYSNNDVDMNGITQYAGAGVLDTPYILQNILSYPGNFLNLSTWQIQEQLPEN